jgi:hypothetical protein
MTNPPKRAKAECTDYGQFFPWSVGLNLGLDMRYADHSNEIVYWLPLAGLSAEFSESS